MSGGKNGRFGFKGVSLNSSPQALKTCPKGAYSYLPIANYLFLAYCLMPE
jgi:hypothetical protein